MSALRVFILVTALGALAGLSAVYLLGPALGTTSSFGGAFHDGYLELARSLAAGHGYVFLPGGDPVFHRPPGYPLLLAPFMLLPEPLHQPLVIVLNATFIGAMAACLVRLSRVFGLGERETTWTILLMTANPWLLWSIKNPMSVLLQSALYVFLVTRAVEIWRQGPLPGIGNVLGIALAATALALVHATALPLLLVCIAALIVAGIVRRQPFWVAAPLAALLLMGSAILPWSYRNYVVTGQLIPVSGNAGIAYFAGYAHWRIDAPAGMAGGASAEDRALAYAGVDRSADEAMHFWGLRDPALEAHVNQAFVEHVLSHPVAVIKKAILNALEFYVPAVRCALLEGVACGLEPLARSIYYAGLWALAVAGALLAPPLVSAVALGAIVVWVAPYLPFLTFIGHSMYNFGTLPFLALLASVAVARVALRVMSPRAA